MGKRAADEGIAVNNYNCIKSKSAHYLRNKRARNVQQQQQQHKLTPKTLRTNNCHNTYWQEQQTTVNNSSETSTSTTSSGSSSSVTSTTSIHKQSTATATTTNDEKNILNHNNIKYEETSPHTESPKPIYTLLPSFVNGTILTDLNKKSWRLGRPIGKGNFGEIFLASDNIGQPVSNENAKYVVKIEPHTNGPLFVEIHCLMNTSKLQENLNTPYGIPPYIASGSHYFSDARYRFLVLPRYDTDLHALIKNCRVKDACVLSLAINVLNALEALHDRGYCHNDIKAQNIMLSKCEMKIKANNNNNNNNKNVMHKCDFEEKLHTTDSGNSSEQEEQQQQEIKQHRLRKQKLLRNQHFNYILDDEEEEETAAGDLINDEDSSTSASNNSNSMDIYKTPVTSLTTKRRKRRVAVVEFSGSNPVRSCRKKTNHINYNNNNKTSTYDEMVKSHYLRPRGRISYHEFFNEDAGSNSDNKDYFYNKQHVTHTNEDEDDDDDDDDDDDEEEFLPSAALRRSMLFGVQNSKSNNNKLNNINACQRLTRHKLRLLNENNKEKSLDIKSTNTIKTETTTTTTKHVEDNIYLIDFGLASKYIDNGIHRAFVMDQRRAHDGTLEFTSRDAHMGAHSRRSDLECLGYNLLYWSQGYLPWANAALNHQQEQVHHAKEFLMADVCTLLKYIYGKDVPTYLGDYLQLVGQLTYQERPDYARYRHLFKLAYKQIMQQQLNNITLTRDFIISNCIRMERKIGISNNILLMRHAAIKNGSCDNSQLHNNNFSPAFVNGINIEATNETLNVFKHLPTLCTPFQDRSLNLNRISPKNLRSKSNKKKSKEHTTTTTKTPIINNTPATIAITAKIPELFLQDPDEIARIRAEKEFEREEKLLTTTQQNKMLRRFTGKPTYAIINILQKRGLQLPKYDDIDENSMHKTTTTIATTKTEEINNIIKTNGIKETNSNNRHNRKCTTRKQQHNNDDEEEDDIKNNHKHWYKDTIMQDMWTLNGENGIRINGNSTTDQNKPPLTNGKSLNSYNNHNKTTGRKKKYKQIL